MPVLITTDSGRSVDVADPANAQVVADSFDRLLKRATDAETKADKAQATADKATEDLAEARKASSDVAIGERVKAISATQALARKVAGDGFTCDSLDVIEIKHKLSQNHPAANVEGAAAALQQLGGEDNVAVADLMRERLVPRAGDMGAA